MLPRAILFDLDNTLAESKQPISAAMADTVADLVAQTHVAVISGGGLAQLSRQVAEQLPASASLTNLFLMPTSGAALYRHANDSWVQVYEEPLSAEDAKRIEQALKKGVSETGLIDLDREQYGPYIENRGAQISLSALGQQAPLEAKVAWDPDRTKREALRAAIAPQLPDFDVKIGGTTTIDITKHGINKAWGVRKLAAYLSISIDDMLYVGDELIPGGNDDVVKETGITTHAVTDPNDTQQFIQHLLRTP